jgi:hypothetical protein
MAGNQVNTSALKVISGSALSEVDSVGSAARNELNYPPLGQAGTRPQRQTGRPIGGTPVKGGDLSFHSGRCTALQVRKFRR